MHTHTHTRTPACCWSHIGPPIHCSPLMASLLQCRSSAQLLWQNGQSSFSYPSNAQFYLYSCWKRVCLCQVWGKKNNYRSFSSQWMRFMLHYSQVCCHNSTLRCGFCCWGKITVSCFRSLCWCCQSKHRVVRNMFVIEAKSEWKQDSWSAAMEAVKSVLFWDFKISLIYDTFTVRSKSVHSLRITQILISPLVALMLLNANTVHIKNALQCKLFKHFCF